MGERTTRVIALVALGISVAALALALYAVRAQHESEERLRAIGRELSESLTPVLPMRPPPPSLDPDPL